MRHTSISKILAKFLLGPAILLVLDGSTLHAQQIVTDREQLAEFRSRAENGNATSQYLLGYAHDHGILGLIRDNSEAEKWYLNAAEQGYAKAQRIAGDFARDSAEAATWYRKAAEQNDPWAQYSLARLYLSGRGGVSKNPLEAFVWLTIAESQDAGVPAEKLISSLNKSLSPDQVAAGKERVKDWLEQKRTSPHKPHADSDREQLNKFNRKAEIGNATSQYILGRVYYYGELGVAKDKKTAMQWYRKAAEQGYAEAQARLGYCYYHGIGVETNYVEAVKWYRKAAEQNHPYAQDELGVCYATGHGAAKDLVEAAKWYWKAAERNNDMAQCHLASCYRDGSGLSQDPVEAYKWWLIALKSDHGMCAERNLSILGMTLSPEQIAKATQDAREWTNRSEVVKKRLQYLVPIYRKDAEKGEVGGQWNLALCYANGEGVAKDDAEALKWFRKVAEQYRYPGILTSSWTALGDCYAIGKGTPIDNIQAYKWYYLSFVAWGHAEDKLAALEAKMQKEKIAQAKKQADGFC